jgi:MOSC domain
MTASLQSIWIKRAHRGPMDSANTGRLIAGRGLVGNADQGRRRQVTIIEKKSGSPNRDVRLRISGETKPCERMGEALRRLRSGMRASWGGGAFAEVLDDGEITVGDEVGWER